MSAYLFSPDLKPVGIYFTEAELDDVRRAVARWMKQGAVVEFQLRGNDESSVLVNFASIASVLIREKQGDDVVISGEVSYWISGLEDASVML